MQTAPTPPPDPEVDVFVKTIQLDGNTRILQCYCKSHLRFEPEYGLKRGTTTNCYLIQVRRSSCVSFESRWP